MELRHLRDFLTVARHQNPFLFLFPLQGGYVVFIKKFLFKTNQTALMKAKGV
jgi:hypothetical protein